MKVNRIFKFEILKVQINEQDRLRYEELRTKMAADEIQFSEMRQEMDDNMGLIIFLGYMQEELTS